MTELHIRNLEPETVELFRGNLRRKGARARGIPQAEYLRRLVELHSRLMLNADVPGGTSQEHLHLRAVGLEPVTA